MSGKKIFEGNGMEDTWKLRRRTRKLVEVKEAAMEFFDIMLVLLATWIDWLGLESKRTGLEFREPVGIPLQCCPAHRSKAAIE